MVMPSEKVMRSAVENREAAFDGLFVYGVITTGVFCKPSCSSRRARPENLRFFPDTPAALNAGFRPCKRCKPAPDNPGLTALIGIARYIETHAEQRLTLAGLAKRAGLSASYLQRRFKAVFGVSPKAYQDAVRMRCLKSALQQGDGVTDAIYQAGFGSLSRFYGEPSRNIGMTPKAYRSGGAGETVAYACCSSALGPLMLAATGKGVCFVQFGEDRQALFTQLQREFPNAELIASAAQERPELEAWIAALDDHVSRGAPQPSLPLDLRGTAFQVKVWRFLLSVSEGEVLSYTELAARIEKPKAVRAVASACAANRIGVLIPCHRVLRSDGGLGGYRWGLERKRALLDLERARVRGSDGH